MQIAIEYTNSPPTCPTRANYNKHREWGGMEEAREACRSMPQQQVDNLRQLHTEERSLLFQMVQATESNLSFKATLEKLMADNPALAEHLGEEAAMLTVSNPPPPPRPTIMRTKKHVK